MPLLDDVRARVSRYARMAARPRGLRYLVKRPGESVAWHFRERPHRRQVRALVASVIAEKGSPVDVPCVGHIADHVAPLPNRKGAFAIGDRMEDGRLCDLSRVIGQEQPAAKASALIIYATVGLLSVWERLEEDLDLCFARGYRQIVLVLSTGRFRPLDFEGYSYLLSVLLSSFPRNKFITRLDVFVAQEFLNVPGRPLLRQLQALAEEAWQKLRRLWRPRSGSESVSPTHFLGADPVRGSRP